MFSRLDFIDNDPLDELIIDRRCPVNIPNPFCEVSDLEDPRFCDSGTRIDEIEFER